MKMKLLPVVALAVFAMIYLFGFQKVSNEYLVSHGWKGGGCGLPDILDFRDGALTADEDALYSSGRIIGHIVKREYRFHADPYVDVLSAATGETCRYWAKWPN